MQEPIREPQTEEEAQELKRFLEEGAETAVETTRTFRPAALPDFLEDVGVIPFDVSPEELVAELAGDDDQLILDVEVAGVSSSEDPPLLVFAGTDGAAKAREANADDPAFVGALAFFVGSPERGLPHEMTFRFRLNVTAAVRADPAATPLSVGLVSIPSDRPADVALAVASAEIQLVRSVVGE